MFTALSVGYAIVCKKTEEATGGAGAAAQGKQTRIWFLGLAKSKMSANSELVPGLSVRECLLADRTSPEEYISAMSPPITGQRQWGGFAEAAVIAFHWGVRVGFFARCLGREEVFLLLDPVGPEGAVHRIALLWTGGHYEALVMDNACWKKACTPLTAHGS